MLYLALGFVLLGLLVVGPRAMGRLARASWRPGAGMLAVACFVGAAILGVMERLPPAAALAILGLLVSLGMRRARPKPEQPPPRSAGRMDLATAASILGVTPDASEAEVQAAYRRLIVRTHPDQGGTEGLAAELNTARETMLRR